MEISNLTFELIGGSIPDFITLDASSGKITGVPDDLDVGQFEFFIRGSGENSEEFSQKIKLTINNVNEAPDFETLSPPVADEDAIFTYQLTANDEDEITGFETLTYTAVSTLPSWLNLSSSGLLQGTPTNDDVGQHTVTIKVTDKAGLSDEKSVSITVNNTNDPPLIEVADLPAKEGDIHEFDEGDVIKFALEVTDDDAPKNNTNGVILDTFKYEVISNQDVSWLGLDSYGDEAIYPDVATIEVTTNDAEVGEYQVAFKVTDSAGATHTTDMYTFIINNINDPVYISDGQTSLFRSETDNQYIVLITDEDLADTYTFTATGLPTWMSLDATGVLSGTPTRADDGVYNISITVEDAVGLSDTKTIQITSTSYEYSILGLEDDFFIGDNDRDWIETGGGSDEVYAGAGDDVVKVQGQGDSTVDTGTGDDEVVVGEDWSGTLLLKNGVGNNTLDIHQTIQSMQSVDGTDLKIVFSNGNEILIEDHYVLNANTVLTRLVTQDLQRLLLRVLRVLVTHSLIRS